jgi:deoxyribodipyrimidine photo-lyase
MKINLFWFRRDLRLDDNPGLDSALMAGLPVLVLFIFDTNITEDLPPDDPRIGFIYESLGKINRELVLKNGSLCILKGDPLEEFGKLLQAYSVDTVYANRDYEPYPAERDSAVSVFLKKHNIRFLTFKDHVIYEKDEVVKQDKSPYRVFTPYKNAWLKRFAAGLNTQQPAGEAVEGDFVKSSHSFPSLEQLGFRENQTRVGPYDLSVIKDYGKYRNFPAADRTSRLSPHLRFGTVSIRKIVSLASATNQVFLEELIWREFFMQILFHFPAVVTDNFRPSFNRIRWRNNESEFRRWCNGETGYPIVDAGMRQLNLTGFMHNRVRMITAGFLCKHLLTDWRFGEAYFASKLLDYELSSNNGNWQWAAGTGCDAAQYFRIFNPLTQERKFDPSGEYTGKWVPEKRSPAYQAPVVDHTFARERAMEAYHISMKEF